MHHPIDMLGHTTAFVTPVVEHWLEREIAQWVHLMESENYVMSHNVIPNITDKSKLIEQLAIISILDSKGK